MALFIPGRPTIKRRRAAMQAALYHSRHDRKNRVAYSATLSGEATVGQTLTAVLIGPTSSISYQWLRDGEPIVAGGAPPAALRDFELTAAKPLPGSTTIGFSTPAAGGAFGSISQEPSDAAHLILLATSPVSGTACYFDADIVDAASALTLVCNGVPYPGSWLLSSPYTVYTPTDPVPFTDGDVFSMTWQGAGGGGGGSVTEVDYVVQDADVGHSLSCLILFTSSAGGFTSSIRTPGSALVS